jgi:hypothetical protein
VPSRSVCRRIISSPGFYKGSRLPAATKYCLRPERPNSPHLHFLEQSATTGGEYLDIQVSFLGWCGPSRKGGVGGVA